MLLLNGSDEATQTYHLTYHGLLEICFLSNLLVDGDGSSADAVCFD